MYEEVSKLLMYGSLPEDAILSRISGISKRAERGEEDADELRAALYREIKRLLILATDCGFDRDLWQCYLAYLLAMQENPFSLTTEGRALQEGSVNSIVLADMAVFRKIFHYDFSALEAKLGTDILSRLQSYKAVKKKEKAYNKAVSEKICALAEGLDKASSDEDFFRTVTDFYRDYGVGMFGINRAFRIKELSGGEIELMPVSNMDSVLLSDLVGYESQKKRLSENTEAFCSGRRANNVLLYGDSGTGKSTSIKAVVNEYYPKGLRMIEIYKHQFHLLSALISKIKNRNYRFIIYMDDLSFEEFESEYKFLKAVIEGGVESRPDNVLIYATSNRRHLIKELWADRADIERQDEVHRSDTMEEKSSLSQRFGLSIGYYRPKKAEFMEIVRVLAEREGLAIPEEELYLEANKWEMQGGGYSGRTARQFIDHLAGTRG